ncbi:MAG: PP2C family protein-serine/threonine phosphatase [Acidobacteriota bacterium]
MDSSRKRTLDELIQLPEQRAVRAFFDDLNQAVLFRMSGLLTVAAILAALVLAAEGEYWRLVVPVATLVMIRGFHYLRDRKRLEARFRPLLIGYLVLQLLLIKVLWLAPNESYFPMDFFLPLVLLFFRLPSAHLTTVLGLLWASTTGRDLVMAATTDQALNVGAAIGYGALVMAVFAVARSATRKRYQGFLTVWRREHQRHRERLRMREELDQARRIQLSMLPRSDPSTPWLDIAGISIPASEVGGDYYEFFRVGETRQAVVVADVAGHGVASGLLLAGVRSCLYLLKETPSEPVEVLGKLDRVVRETTGRREFVTMIYGLFDQESRRVQVSAAGHPPMLRYVAATGEVEEIGPGSLPLGTPLAGSIEQIEVPFEPDDLFLAYTDGIAETVNSRGELYGTERLGERLRAIHHDRTAKEIRDTLLGDVWSFKADGEQTDDITLVVVRIR